MLSLTVFVAGFWIVSFLYSLQFMPSTKGVPTRNIASGIITMFCIAPIVFILCFSGVCDLTTAFTEE